MDYELCTPAEVADTLGISSDAVSERARAGQWPVGSVFDFGNGLRRYRLDLILADALERGDEVGRRAPVAAKKRQPARRRPSHSLSKEERRRRLEAI